MQRNWIGRSHGANVHFPSAAGDITVFTTRPDTLFGATFMVLAPEHPYVDELTTSEQADAVAEYRRQAAAKKDVDRQDENREKTGVWTGSYATNPLSGEQIQVWIADYVLMGYGTGAIMAVPAGDQRDFEFARKFDLPIPAIQEPPAAWFEQRDIEPTIDTTQWPEAFVGDGVYVNSSNDTLDLNGIDNKTDGIATVNAWLEETGKGEATITYKLRDWLFSRQRYWGEPFPVVYDADGFPHTLPDSMLPVELPETDSFSPRTFDPDDEFSNPESPLDRLDDWITVDARSRRRTASEYRRDSNVMPQWAGSCWYQLRYMRPDQRPRPVHARSTERGRTGWARSTDRPARPSGRHRPVRRRRRARRTAPAVRPVLAQGAVRPGAPVVARAVRPAVQPGLHAWPYAFTDARGIYVDAFAVVGRRRARATRSRAISRSPASTGRWARA